MARIKDEHTLFIFYNMYRFERFAHRILSFPIYGFSKVERVERPIPIPRRTEENNWSGKIDDAINDIKGGVSIYIAGLQVNLLLTIFFLSIVNFVCAWTGNRFDAIWFTGAGGSVIVAVLISNYLAPSNRKNYLRAFQAFEGRSPSWKRRSALITLLIVLAVWLMFTASFLV